jgi:tetratricopeptide (TPR) repeat protein
MKKGLRLFTARWALSWVLLLVFLAGCSKTPEELYKDALMEMESGQVEVARQRLEAVIDQDPTMVKAYQHLLNIYLTKNDISEAVVLLEKWRDQQPFNAQVQVQLAGLYLRSDRFDEALGIYEDLIASTKDARQKASWERSVQILKTGRQRQDRIGELTRQLGQDTGNPVLYLELGSLYFKVGQNFTVARRTEMGQGYLEKAYELLSQAQKLATEQAESGAATAEDQVLAASAEYHLGQYHLFHVDFEKAIEAFQMAREYDPEEPLFPFVLGQVYLQREKTDLALEMIKKAIEIAPERAAYYMKLSEVYDVLEMPEESYEALRKADAVTADEATYLFLLAKKKDEAGAEPEEIIAILEEAMDKEPDNLQYRFSLAGFLGQAGRDEESLEQLREVIRRGGGTPFEARARQEIERTEQRMAAGQMEE